MIEYTTPMHRAVIDVEVPRISYICSMIEQTVGVYIIRNTVNNKIYIGSSKVCRSRINTHKHDLRHNKHHSSHLQRAWNTYGEKRFLFYIIEKVKRIDDLEKAEQYWIDLYQSYDGKYGYNLAKLAYSNKGHKHSDETKKLISTIVSKTTQTVEFREACRQRNLGKTLSQDTKDKIGLTQKGRKDYNITAAQESRKRSVIQIKSDGSQVRYNSVGEADEVLGLHRGSAGRILRKHNGLSRVIDGQLQYC